MVKGMNVFKGACFGLLCGLLLAPAQAMGSMVMYDEFTGGLDTTTRWTVTGTAYYRAGKGDGDTVELAAGYQTGQIETKGYDFVLPTPAQVGGSLTVQVNYENLNYWSHGYISACQFNLLGVDGANACDLGLRKSSSSSNWMWWRSSTSSWVSTSVPIAAQNAAQLVRLTLTNVDGVLVPSATVSNDNGATWITVFTGTGQSAVWPAAVKLRLYENWTSCWIDDVAYENLTAAEMPTFTPDGGDYFDESQSVEILCGTPNAEIHYTLTGDPPTRESELYRDRVTVNPGQTLSARAWAPDHNPSPVKSGQYKAFNNPVHIPRADGSVVVDGNLSEWLPGEFVPMTYNYSGTPHLDNASYAARWDGSTNQFYVAVKVKDTNPVFADNYSGWNTQDGIEVYAHTTGGEPYNYEMLQSTAQQYVLGLKTPDHRTTDPTQNVWATFAGYVDVPRDQVGFQAAGVEEKDSLGNRTGWLFYEVKVTAYQLLSLTSPIISPLSVGEVVGVDVTACDKYAGGFGMKSENNKLSKHSDWRNIGVHKLSMHPADVNADGQVSAADIDALQAAVRAGSTDPRYDLNKDSTVSSADVDYLVNTLFGTVYGDANLDRRCTFEDFARLQNHYGQSGGWSTGDFNGDGTIGFADFGLLQNNYGHMAAGSRSSAAAQALSELPCSVLSLALLMIAGLGSLSLRQPE